MIKIKKENYKKNVLNLKEFLTDIKLYYKTKNKIFKFSLLKIKIYQIRNQDMIMIRSLLQF